MCWFTKQKRKIIFNSSSGPCLSGQQELWILNSTLLPQGAVSSPQVSTPACWLLHRAGSLGIDSWPSASKIRSCTLKQVGKQWPVGHMHLTACSCSAPELRRVITFSNSWQKAIKRKIFQDMWKLYEIQVPVSSKWSVQHSHSFVYMLSMSA